MASHYKGAVKCSLLALWKQLVSEVGTREKMCLEMFSKVDDKGAERMCSGRLFQPTGPATRKKPTSQKHSESRIIRQQRTIRADKADNTRTACVAVINNGKCLNIPMRVSWLYFINRMSSALREKRLCLLALHRGLYPHGQHSFKILAEGRTPQNF